MTLVWITSAGISGHARGGDAAKEQALPPSLEMRIRGHPTWTGESCGECPIFVHGFKYIGTRFDRILLFLGAPDYLSETNSFLPVYTDSRGNWVAGGNIGEDWLGSDFLDGTPGLFVHSDQHGYFLTTAWQVEGPRNLFYFSTDGLNWIEVRPPEFTRKEKWDDCCLAADLSEICIANSGTVYFSYRENAAFEEAHWQSDASSWPSDDIEWTKVERIPYGGKCDSYSPGPDRYIPYNLKEKSERGVVLEFLASWAVLIPGPAK